jgi:Bacteriophage clamp loader A subunit
MNPFQFLSDIQFDKKNSMASEPELEKEYVPFFVNRGLSQHKDCIFAANEMNQTWDNLDHRIQYEYLLQVIPKAKRFGKWAKRVENEDIKAIHDAFECSWSRAREYAQILNNEDIQALKEQLTIGGQKE